MPINWRTTSGLALTTVIATAIVLVDRHFMALPDPAPLCLAAVALAAAIGGTTAGLTSAIVSILFTTTFVKLHGPAALGNETLIRLVLFWFAAPIAALAVGALRAKLAGLIRDDRERRAVLAGLSRALDAMDIGVVVLDRDTRAQFINRAFRRTFIVSDELASTKPPFVALMYHGRDTRAYAMREEDLQSYVARRVAQMRRAEPTSADLQLANGQVLRMRCVPLADGGRMLTYVPITDLIRQSDNPADHEALLALRTRPPALPMWTNTLHAAE